MASKYHLYKTLWREINHGNFACGGIATQIAKIFSYKKKFYLEILHKAAWNSFLELFQMKT